jgi:hypothetical protein
MMNWFGLNIPLMMVLVCCWAGIPLWHVLTRWGAEFKAKHAEVAARAVAVPVLGASGSGSGSGSRARGRLPGLRGSC